MKHQYDVIIVGAGLAGLRAAVEIGNDAHVAVMTKVFATRSHSGAAQGGIGAALGNEEEDHWEWHMFDRTPSRFWQGMRPGPFMNWKTSGFPLTVLLKVKSPSGLLAGIRAITAKHRSNGLAMRRREPAESF